jgi:superfamily II helicase
MECRVCKIEKNINFMVKHKTDRICKECNKIYRKSKYIYKTRPWSDLKNQKICRSCNQILNLENFSKHKGGKYGVDTICKVCAPKLINTPEGVERTKQWIKNNREIVNKRAVDRDKILSKEDPEYRIKKHLRVRMWETIIKNSKSTRNGKVEELIGCSVEYYRKHIENQWKPDMNWKNHGSLWEIDHIIPLDFFNLMNTNDQKQAFSYNNVQPLYKSDNRRKKNKINGRY